MIKKSIRYILSFILYYSRLISILRWLQRRKNGLKILVYHRVNEDLDGSSPALPIARFKKHLFYLRINYKIVNLAKAVSAIKSNEKLPSCAVVITFDDGYKDIIKNVFPLVKEFDVPITIFLTTGCIGDDKTIWTDALYFYFKEKGKTEEFRQFREKLKNLDNDERIKVLESLRLKSKENLMLNWEGVRELSKDIHIEIGAHTQTHPILTKVDIDTAMKEIQGSKKEIELKIGKPIAGFSYPAGKSNEEIKRIVRDSGFDYACSVDGRFNTRRSDLYCLSRINIDNCPIFVFAAELCGVNSWLRRLFRIN